MESMGHDAHALARPLSLRAALAALALAGALALSLAVGRADAAPQVRVLGAAAPANPACPDDPCYTTGLATVFQSQIGKAENPFRVPYAGKIVAWSIKLARPLTTNPDPDEESQVEFFNRFYGGPPSARLAVLQPNMKKIKQGKPAYTLKSQSPVEQLMPYLGTTTTFTLQHPLSVKKNQVVGLTLPTWAPLFAVNTGSRTVWHASRKRGKCAKSKDIRAGKPQQKLGQQRAYGCTYRNGRMLYSATLVKRP